MVKLYLDINLLGTLFVGIFAGIFDLCKISTEILKFCERCVKINPCGSLKIYVLKKAIEKKLFKPKNLREN